MGLCFGQPPTVTGRCGSTCRRRPAMYGPDTACKSRCVCLQCHCHRHRGCLLARATPWLPRHKAGGFHSVPTVRGRACLRSISMVRDDVKHVGHFEEVPELWALFPGGRTEKQQHGRGLGQGGRKLGGLAAQQGVSGHGHSPFTLSVLVCDRRACCIDCSPKSGLGEPGCLCNAVAGRTHRTEPSLPRWPRGHVCPLRLSRGVKQLISLGISAALASRSSCALSCET